MRLIKKKTELINLLIICLILYSGIGSGENITANIIWEDAIGKNELYYDSDIISGNLDLSDIRLPGARLPSIVIKNSIIKGELNLRGVTIEDEANFAGTTFESNVIFNETNFGGPANFENSIFKKEVFFNESDLNGAAKFGNSRFEDNAVFVRAKFGKNARFQNATFEGEACFNESEFNTKESNEETTFDHSKVNNNAYFEKAKFHKSASFHNVTFEKEALFNYAEYNEAVEFDDSKFKNEVSFKNAELKGPASFKRSLFCKDINFESSMFAGPAIFDYAIIEGDITFAHVDIYSDFTRASFSKNQAIILNSSRVERLNIDPKYIDTNNLSCDMLESVLVKFEVQDRSSGKLKQLYNDKCILPPEDFFKYLFFLINKHILRWSTLDGIINIFKIFLIFTFFIFPLFYLIMGCLGDSGKIDEVHPSRVNHIYDCYYFSITNALSHRSSELKRRSCSWGALLQFILSCVLLSLIGSILVNGRLIG